MHVGAWRLPMAEQQTTTQYLLQTADVDRYLADFKEKFIIVCAPLQRISAIKAGRF